MSRSTSEPQAEFDLLDRARPAAPKPRRRRARLPGSEISPLQLLPLQDSGAFVVVFM
jgi:hypothetical protein